MSEVWFEINGEGAIVSSVAKTWGSFGSYDHDV
jgi:hypothetical protein